MPIVVVVGGQWGDEGKGRIVDLLARKARVVARYSAGNNAGHTIVNERGEFKLHVVPAGIFYPDKTCVIGNGVAVDPEVLLGEIDSLQSRGIDTSRLVLSDRAHLIMPWHKTLDQLDEAARGDAAIGTTGKGVGPCFIDKVARRGIRVTDIVRAEDLKPRMEAALGYANKVITGVYGGQPLQLEECFDNYLELGKRLAPFIGDHGVLLLYRRSLHLSRSNHPLLAPLLEIAQTPVGDAHFSGLKSALEREAPAAAEEASRALFSTFTGLLATLIGEALTTRLLAPVPREDETHQSPQEISK